MRIAICLPEIEQRHTISALLETSLMHRGVLPEVSLYPMLPELLAASAQKDVFDLVLVSAAQNKQMLHELCQRATVIVLGDISDGPFAFEIGAEYFVEQPANLNKLDKAIEKCLI